MSHKLEETLHCTIIRLQHERIQGPDQLLALDREIEQVIAHQPARGILLDCAALPAVSSAFLGRLVQWKQKATAVGGDLKLCGLQPIVQQVFQMSRLDQRFAILPTRAEGLESFAPRA
jgi:anti-sigma B factor antagonist